jgi:predicted RNA-binding protein YlqC (UPF0109 family)
LQADQPPKRSYRFAEPKTMEKTELLQPELENRLRSFITLLVQAVVDSPDDVRIECDPDEASATFKVHVAPTDLGKAIGKQGRIANAIRVLTKAAAMKDKQKVYLEVVGEDNSRTEM